MQPNNLSHLNALLDLDNERTTAAVTQDLLMSAGKYGLDWFLKQSVATKCFAAFIGGSHVEGLGNTMSDVDLYLIVDGQSADARVAITNLDYPDSSLRLDIEQWEIERIDQIVSKLRSLRFEEERIVAVLNGSEERFVHRLFCGLAVDNRENFAGLVSYVNKSIFKRYLVCKSVALVHETAEDLWGCLDARDVVSAIGRSQDLVRFSFDGYAASLGETNPSAKWRGRKYLSIVGAGKCNRKFAARLIPFLFSTAELPGTFRCCLEYAEEAFDLANAMLTSAEHERVILC
jgi:hypothetical protein